jgi:hypothetical protein
MIIDKKVPLPDPSITDPCMQPVLPNFYFMQFPHGAKDSLECALPSLERLQELHFDLCAVSEAVQNNNDTFQRVPESSTNRQAYYYSFNKEITITLEMQARLPLLGAITTATLCFSAVKEEYKMSPLQCNSFAESSILKLGNVREQYYLSNSCYNKETPLEDLERQRVIRTKKSVGNALYASKDNAGAYNIYCEAIVEYENLLGDVKARTGKVVSDWNLITSMMNLYNNRAQAALRTKKFDEVIFDAIKIVTQMNKSNSYTPPSGQRLS